jgi:hypothetical protein
MRLKLLSIEWERPMHQVVEGFILAEIDNMRLLEAYKMMKPYLEQR